MKSQLEILVAAMYGGGILYAEAVNELKKAFILHVIAECEGNKCKAAKELHMHRNTLDREIDRHNLRAQVKACRPYGRHGQQQYYKPVQKSQAPVFRQRAGA